MHCVQLCSFAQDAVSFANKTEVKAAKTRSSHYSYKI